MKLSWHQWRFVDLKLFLTRSVIDFMVKPDLNEITIRYNVEKFNAVGLCVKNALNDVMIVYRDHMCSSLKFVELRLLQPLSEARVVWALKVSNMLGVAKNKIDG